MVPAVVRSPRDNPDVDGSCSDTRPGRKAVRRCPRICHAALASADRVDLQNLTTAGIQVGDSQSPDSQGGSRADNRVDNNPVGDTVGSQQLAVVLADPKELPMLVAPVPACRLEDGWPRRRGHSLRGSRRELSWVQPSLCAGGDMIVDRSRRPKTLTGHETMVMVKENEET